MRLHKPLHNTFYPDVFHLTKQTGETYCFSILRKDWKFLTLLQRNVLYTRKKYYDFLYSNWWFRNLIATKTMRYKSRRQTKTTTKYGTILVLVFSSLQTFVKSECPPFSSLARLNGSSSICAQWELWSVRCVNAILNAPWWFID